MYIATRHKTTNSKRTLDVKIKLAKQYNLATKHRLLHHISNSVPVSWYTVEAGGHDTVYSRINGTAYVPSKCTLPDETIAPLHLLLLCEM